MTNSLFPFNFISVKVCLIAAVTLFCVIPLIHALGSGSTLAVTDDSGTVCGIVAGEPTKRIECYRRGQIVPVTPNISFSSISGGRSYFCGLRSGNYSLLCWDTVASDDSFEWKKLYSNYNVLLENLAVGDVQVCATVVGLGTVKCWRKHDTFHMPSGSDQFTTISSGSGFSCGILKNTSRVQCWGMSSVSKQIQNEFGDKPMLSLVAGDSHVCGLNSTGSLVCRGSNSSGQLDVPNGGPLEYSGLALGAEHSCAIRSSNRSVVCWGGRGQFSVNITEGLSFELIVSATNFTCGLISSNF